MNILAHTSFIGTTGYANHARSFFCALNKYHKVRVRNLTIGNSWNDYNEKPHEGESYITDEMKDMLILQSLFNADGSTSDYPIYNFKKDFVPDVHIVLVETDNIYFYHDYDGYKIAYNVWESTLYPDNFFKRLFYFDEVWVPTKWQFDCLVAQGYPAEKISIVPEGVDVDTFKPIEKYPQRDKIRFVYFGRWDYRKGTTEVLRAFGEVFKDVDDVELIASVENPYPNDGLKSTEERIKKHEIDTEKITFLNFPSREEYVKYLQEAHVFVSCARSEGWNLPLIEAMACGTPAIYSNWGGQLEFAEGKGVPVSIKELRPANIERKEFPGEYCEPDWDDLKWKMRQAYDYQTAMWIKSRSDAKDIHKNFNWETIAENASKIINSRFKSFAFVTTGNLQYMPVIEKLVQSLMMFSRHKIIVYGVDCEVPFDYPNVIRKTINPPKISEHDKWYWKQWACLESLNEDFDYYIWVDGDVVVNYNIDTVTKYFKHVGRYPLSDIHVQEEFFGTYDDGKTQLFNEELAKRWGVEKQQPYMHICFYIYNQGSRAFFDGILGYYDTMMKGSPEDYKRYFLWNDEGIDNAIRWNHGFTNHLPISNFDTSSYDGDEGFIDKTLHQFYKFWNEDGPQNFNRIFGYQFIPEDKSNILYFHGNKNAEISDKMIEFIKMKRDDSFYKSYCFYTDVYKLENFNQYFNIEGGTIEIANKHGWFVAIFHEIFNLLDYYKNRERRIFDGDVVVELGGNIGIFNRWAYSQGASKVISFEPDKRYFKLLSLNADPRSVLFNAAGSDSIGELSLFESTHIGGSNLFGTQEGAKEYKVRTYTLDYLFETGLVDKIDFLKVDIEGAEHHAFKGISDENLMKVKNISMEYHHSHFDYDEELRQDLINRMVRLGFNPYTLFMGDNNALQMIYFTR
jgi:FkbM family methyltransferase